jgi:hypothetical protein
LRRFALPRSGYRHGTPKCRALPVEPHPDIHFSVMIPRRGVKIKFFLSVVIPVVKTAFVPPSATGESPVNAGAARLCGLLSKPRMDRVYALPNQARYQLRYTRIFNFCHDTTAERKNKDFLSVVILHFSHPTMPRGKKQQEAGDFLPAFCCFFASFSHC